MAICDFLIIGGGIAGMSVASRLAARGKTIVFEQEDQAGYHASGRSVTLFNVGLGNASVQKLTRISLPFFKDPPAHMGPVPLLRPLQTLYVARDTQHALLQEKYEILSALIPSVRMVGVQDIKARVPILKMGGDGIVAGLLDDRAGRIDGHGLLHGFARECRAKGGRIELKARVYKISHGKGGWTITAGDETYRTRILINAAGAWADEVARQAGVAALGLSPMRRTVIVVDGPKGVGTSCWPFVRSVDEEFYFLPEGGDLLVSPADETPTLPCDVQAEEYDVALAAHRFEQMTTHKIKRVKHKWAGLRSFFADRVPAVGFDVGATGFFWLAGQGGYGLQTAPALSELACALICEDALPPSFREFDFDPGVLSPARFIG